MSSSALNLASSGALVGTKLATPKQSTPLLVQRQSQGVAASAQTSPAAVSRRDALLLATSAAALGVVPLSTPAAFALGAPKGYAALEDSKDRYRFFYPFGWQEVTVKGQDVVFKDVIEPLENVAVNVINTDKTDIRELGSPDAVAQVLVERVLTGPTQKAQLVKAEEKENNGKSYYVFEFVAAAPGYKRHALGVVSVANGKFYTLTTGSNERRWNAMEEKLRAVVNSFEAI